MKRILVAAAAVFPLLGLMFQSLSLESDAAQAATNGSASLNTVDSVIQSIGYAGATGIPLGLIIAILAMVLAGLVAVGGR